MNTGKRGGFMQGFLAGALSVLVTTLVVVILQSSGSVAPAASLESGMMTQLSAWTDRNLGYSLPVFVLILVLYFHSLNRLRKRLSQERPVEEVAQSEHLVDIWTSLFFGVGVIWTAIGMRNALIFALGEPAEAVGEGAFTMLQRMVDGGILLALSTTIVGGIGGYLMRVFKALLVGVSLQRYFDQSAQAQGAGIQRTLDSIEAQLRLLANSGLMLEARSDE